MNRNAWIGVAAATVLVVVSIGAALVLTAGGPTTPAEAMGAPLFVEEAEVAGVQHAYDGDWTFFVGGGVTTGSVFTGAGAGFLICGG